MLRLVISILALSTFACSSHSLYGFTTQELSVGQQRFLVEHQPADKRNIHEDVVQFLRERGHVAEPDQLASPDYIVSYTDRWYWDMRMYMIDFRVDIRDAQSGVLLGTGRSFQTSLSAMGDSYQEVVGRALDVALEGTGGTR